MRRIYSFVLLLAAALSLTSCLDSDTSSGSITLYDDTAIIGFGLGTLNRNIFVYKTTPSTTGEDSTYLDTMYVEKVDCSGYHFTIDQNRGLIYNTDSLPAGLDLKHVACTASAKNGGTVVLYLKPKDEESDSLFYFTSVDSVDFTIPMDSMELRAYNGYLTSYKAYKVQINMHEQNGEDFTWKKLTEDSTLGSLTGIKTICTDNRIFVFGKQDGVGVIYYSALNDGITWQQASSNIITPFSADIAQNVALLHNKLFLLNGTALLSSADGENWEQTSTDAIASLGIKRLVGAANGKLYALCENGLASSADGEVWSEEVLDDSKNWLPTMDVTLIERPLRTNADATNLVLIGNRDTLAYPNDQHAVVWSKIEIEGETNHVWNFYPYDELTTAAPRLENMQVFPYNEDIYSFGRSRINDEEGHDLYEDVYVTRDGGLTWKPDTMLLMPSELYDVVPSAVAATVDSNQFIWMVWTGTGQVWKGRLTKLGWRKEEK